MPFPKRWLAAAALALTALLGLYGASQHGRGAGYMMGLALFAASIFFLFNIVKGYFDGTGDDRTFDLFPRQPRNLWTLLVALGLIGLISLVMAAAGGGVLYSVGIALFAVCCVMGFYVIKLAFDRR